MEYRRSPEPVCVLFLCQEHRREIAVLLVLEILCCPSGPVHNAPESFLALVDVFLHPPGCRGLSACQGLMLVVDYRIVHFSGCVLDDRCDILLLHPEGPALGILELPKRRELYLGGYFLDLAGLQNQKPVHLSASFLCGHYVSRYRCPDFGYVLVLDQEIGPGGDRDPLALSSRLSSELMNCRVDLICPDLDASGCCFPAHRIHEVGLLHENPSLVPLLLERLRAEGGPFLRAAALKEVPNHRRLDRLSYPFHDRGQVFSGFPEPIEKSLYSVEVHFGVYFHVC